jgi:UDP-galactopyranose mutase
MDQESTRVTEFKCITGQVPPGKATIHRNYLRPCQTRSYIPYCSVASNESIAVHARYLELARTILDVFIIGRLAQFKYDNMDAIIDRALCFADEIIAGQLAEIRF